MHYLTGWFIRNPVAANLMMALILVLGVMAIFSIRIEGFPKIPAETITITTTNQGASTAQMDELITKKIEKSLEGIDGVRSISSQSTNELSIVSVRKAGGADLQKILDKVRLRIDGITELPADAQRPVIAQNEFNLPALYLNLHGDTDPVTLQKLARRLREELLNRSEISQLKVWGLFEREMKIDVNPRILQRHNLTVEDVVARIRNNSLTIQSGTLRTKGGAIYLKSDKRARFAAEYRNIPIIERSNGSVVHLADIASIEDGFAEGDYLFRFNGKTTAGMEVLIGRRDNLLLVSEAVKEVVADFERQLPPNVNITLWGDSSNYIADRLSLLANNGVQGLLLVLLVLSLFLNVRLAFWVAMGIPISIMGTLAVVGTKWVDYSLNDITTFGLIIVLGILVDDAVVVGESVFEERQNFPDPISGTEKGVSRVAVATVFGVLTTIAAFFPMLLLDNPLGKVLASFSGIVIIALTFSLIESKFILPAHLAQTSLNQQPGNPISRMWTRLQVVAQWFLGILRDSIYAPVLKHSIHHRYAVLILFIAAGIFGIGLIWTGKIKTAFFPDIPGQIITITLEMDARAPFQLTLSNLERIRETGEELNEELKTEHSLQSLPIRSMFLLVSDAGSAQLYAELTPVAERAGLGILDILNLWRERTGTVEGATRLQFTGSEEPAGGFRIRLFSKDEQTLKLASSELRQFLSEIDGVHNITDTLATGQPQLDIRVKPEARNLGFDTATLSRQIANSFGGAEVQKIRGSTDEIRVVVRNQNSSRDTIDDLLQTQLRSNNGKWISFRTVAEIRGGYVAGTVYRHNGKMVNTVSASINRSRVTPEEAAQAVFKQLVPKLEATYPGLSVKKAGELEEIGEIRGGMIRALILAAILIYVLMAIPLKSYWQPFVILAIIPFGFVGAAIGHLFMDLPLSILSFFGMMALAGVVVNDSLVLITRYNQTIEIGELPELALQEAGISRFRAIFLTTTTTVAGLTPLLMETSEQAQYLIPAAVSLAFGEIFATALMLVLVPVLIAITEDVRNLFGSKKSVTAAT